MKDAVRNNFRVFNAPLEGVLHFMYTDALGLVTTGMGNLIDPVSSALALPWRNPDGSLADAATVTAQWEAVKNGPVNSSVNAGSLTTIRLDDAGIQEAINNTIAVDEPVLLEGFPNYESWPADAQMALWSMAWAMGPGFWREFPQFTAAMNQEPPNFAAAAAPEALGHFQGVGVQARIQQNDFLWMNAQTVQDVRLPTETLYWPHKAGWGIYALKHATTLATIAGVVIGWSSRQFWLPYARIALRVLK